jgi:hypothetical protein
MSASGVSQGVRHSHRSRPVTPPGRGHRSVCVKNPRQIPAMVKGVVSIRRDDIGEFQCAAF